MKVHTQGAVLRTHARVDFASDPFLKRLTFPRLFAGAAKAAGKRSPTERVSESLRLAHELEELAAADIKVGVAALDVGAQLSAPRRSCRCALRLHRRQKRGGRSRPSLFKQPEPPPSRPSAGLGVAEGDGVAQARGDAAAGVAGVPGSASGWLQLQPVRRRYREHLHLAAPQPRMRRTLLPADTSVRGHYAGMTMPVTTAMVYARSASCGRAPCPPPSTRKQNVEQDD